jgi:hypothetical protein
VYYTEAKDVYKNSQYVAGYTIPGIGLVRAGYFGASSFLPQIIQFAFKLTAVDGLGLDVGFSYSLDEATKDAEANPMMVALVAGYGASGFNVDLSAVTKLGGSSDNVYISAIVTPSYALDFGIIGGSFLFKTTLDVDDSTTIGGALWLSKGFAGGNLKVGAALEVPSGADSKINFAIPIELTYSIW